MRIGTNGYTTPTQRFSGDTLLGLRTRSVSSLNLFVVIDLALWSGVALIDLPAGPLLSHKIPLFIVQTDIKKISYSIMP